MGLRIIFLIRNRNSKFTKNIFMYISYSIINSLENTRQFFIKAILMLLFGVYGKVISGRDLWELKSLFSYPY